MKQDRDRGLHNREDGEKLVEGAGGQRESPGDQSTAASAVVGRIGSGGAVDGGLEVTVKPVRVMTPAAREAVNARLRQHRVSLGRATGIDNEGIDADLARTYGDDPSPP